MNVETVYYDAEKDILFTVVQTSPRAVFVYDYLGSHFFWSQDFVLFSKHLKRKHIFCLGEL